MPFPRTYNHAFVYAIIFTVIVTIAALFIYSSLSKWQNSMVEKNKLVCELYATNLLDASEREIEILGNKGLLETGDLSSADIKLIDTTLKKVAEEQLKLHPGLEGGYYLRWPDEFYGYSFPSSPPPVPVYGPPPRSYNIIKSQSLQTIEDIASIINLHSFDAAIFPLATKPIVFNKDVVGVVWVRIHIENELPIIKLKQVVNVAAVISILGFLALMLLSALLGGEIQGIKKEMEIIRQHPSGRLQKRWGIFGYISSNINEMLDTIEEDNNHRQLLERQLNQKEKLASLGNMIAGVAHEVKTPLAIIKTRIQMWEQELKKNPEITSCISSESMEMVIRESNRLAKLVNRLLIFSRPIDKKMKRTDINMLLDEVVSFVSIERNNKSVTIRSSLDRSLPGILVDDNSIRQVIINVLENSYESMSDGGRIDLRSYLDLHAGKIVIDISDKGGGIKEEILDNIFDPFFTSKESGVGLGLAISYQIIKAHNGEIVITNNNDQGVRCIIKLPLDQ